MCALTLALCVGLKSKRQWGLWVFFRADAQGLCNVILNLFPYFFSIISTVIKYNVYDTMHKQTKLYLNVSKGETVSYLLMLSGRHKAFGLDRLSGPSCLEIACQFLSPLMAYKRIVVCRQFGSLQPYYSPITEREGLWLKDLDVIDIRHVFSTWMENELKFT